MSRILSIPAHNRTIAMRAHRPPNRSVVILRDILADVSSQDFVDEGLVPDAAPACFLAELFEHSRIDANRDQLARFVA